MLWGCCVCPQSGCLCCGGGLWWTWGSENWFPVVFWGQITHTVCVCLQSGSLCCRGRALVNNGFWKLFSSSVLRSYNPHSGCVCSQRGCLCCGGWTLVNMGLWKLFNISNMSWTYPQSGCMYPHSYCLCCGCVCLESGSTQTVCVSLQSGCLCFRGRALVNMGLRKLFSSSVLRTNNPVVSVHAVLMCVVLERCFPVVYWLCMSTRW